METFEVLRLLGCIAAIAGFMSPEQRTWKSSLFALSFVLMSFALFSLGVR